MTDTRVMCRYPKMSGNNKRTSQSDYAASSPRTTSCRSVRSKPNRIMILVIISVAIFQQQTQASNPPSEPQIPTSTGSTRTTTATTTATTTSVATNWQHNQQAPGKTTDSIQQHHQHGQPSVRQGKQHNAKSEEAKARRIDSLGSTQGDQQLPMTEKRAFVMELLKLLHDQYGSASATKTNDDRVTKSSIINKMEDRQSSSVVSVPMVSQLMEALGADGDMKRLIDWIRNSFSLASIGEVTTQFVVSKLGAVNCPAILRPDKEETLVPRFLLFNEHYVDVPFELSINPNANDCIANAKFDPNRKTIVLIHGYLAGYTLIDGITNIKNRILDLNKFVNQRAMETFIKASYANAADHGPNGTATNYVFTENLDMKIRSQLYNVVVVDWFNGANPSPRANYIRAAVNAQVVGRLVARFLSALVVQCGTQASNLQIIAHSLGEYLLVLSSRRFGNLSRNANRIAPVRVRDFT